MKRYRFLQMMIFLIVILVLGIGLSSAKDRPRVFTLDNGLRVILDENHSSPVGALQLWVKAGSADESDEEAGICHFIEHMLFKGTERRKTRIAGEIESLGGTFNAYTSYDQTVYHIVIASRYIDAGLDVLADAAMHSVFDPAEIDREREVILEEIRMGQDSPGRAISKQTMSVLFQAHPYRRPIIGYERTIKAMTRDQIVSFFRKWYVPKRMTFIVSGDIDPDRMGNKVKEAFGGFASSSTDFPNRTVEPEPAGFRSALSHGTFRETYFQLALPITSAVDEDTPALDVVAQILGGGEASRLVQKVKLERGLVRSISASSYTPRDRGTFVIGATLSPENTGKALEAISEEIARLKKDGVTAEELHRVKAGIRSSLIYDRQTVQGQARKLGFYEVIAGDIEYEKEYLRRVSVLESDDIRQVMEKYFIPSRMAVSILAPAEKAGHFKDLDLKGLVERAGIENPAIGKANAKALPRSVLDNGIRLIVKENRTLPAVTVIASFLGGVRFEEEARNGISNFMAVMLTRGTKNRSNLEIARKVEAMAGSLSGFSGYNSFGLSFTFLSEHFEEAFALFAEVLREPSFDSEEMEKRRRLILAAIDQQEDDLTRVVFRTFRGILYEKHPYRMDPLGTAASIWKLTPADLKEYYGRFAVPENLVLTVIGDVDEKQVASAVKGRFGGFERGKFSPPSVEKDEPIQKIRRQEIFRKKEQAHFVLGFSGTSFQQPDRYAAEVLDAALSGQGGRLFRELRDKESLAYALDFVGQSNLDPGFMGVYMGTHPDKLETAIQATLRELKKVRDEGLTGDEVERAKRYLIGNFEIGLQTNGARANQICLDELYGIGFDHYEKYPEEILKVTVEDVHRVAREYLRLDAYAIAIIRPPGEEKK
jgi:zinc protease